MKEWTRDERYRVLQNPEELQALYDEIRTSPYRQTYHVQPVTGLSSDPNGFAFHQGKWHLCYQWCPWGAVHGLKYWYHVTSTDLIHWKNEGIGLAPDTYYDNRGTHSGSAISENGDLYFFYTGNHRDEDWTRTPYTCAAVLGSGGKLRKLEKPLFGPRDGYSEHQRDPKIVWVPAKKKYFIFIGAQTEDLKGCALVYESEELLGGWTFAGQLRVPGYENFGGMWECPYIVNISGKDVFIFSPQYTKLPGRGESTNHNVYLIGSMDYDTLTFTPDGPYHFLDYGFDFYAAQGAANVGDPDKAILISWIGLPDNHYPTAEENADWEGSMTIPRELHVRDGKLFQTPISGIEVLRDKQILPEGCQAAACGTDQDELQDGHQSAVSGTDKEKLSGGCLPSACEMEIEIPDGDFEMRLFTREDGTGGLIFRYDTERRICTIDRRGMDNRFNTGVYEVLDMPLSAALRKLRIFIDRNSAEIFVNEGEETFTTHVYPTEREFHYTLGSGVAMKMWKLRASVTDEFVV